MKKTLFTLAIVLLAVAMQAQNTAFKVHSTGQISLQSATTSYGIQIPTNGVMSIEPNVTTAYGLTSLTKPRNLTVRAWCVEPIGVSYSTGAYTFYVLGNGNVYTRGSYLTISPVNPSEKGTYPIEGASGMVSSMKGYYFDSNEFEGVTPEELESSEFVKPEALEGLLHDMENCRTAGLVAEELEEVLPEAVRHDPDGQAGINYDAVVVVLIEAFKEQQARIEQLESVLRENGLMRK